MAAKTDTNVSIRWRCRSCSDVKNWTRIESRAADPFDEGPELQDWRNANEQSKADQTLGRRVLQERPGGDARRIIILDPEKIPNRVRSMFQSLKAE